MNDSDIIDKPKKHADLYIGTLLKTLITSRPKSNLLELGTGVGLSLAWMIEGMNAESMLTTVDNDPKLIKIAKTHFGEDKRIEIICQGRKDYNLTKMNWSTGVIIAVKKQHVRITE